jgi:16S rRNA C967 or C1407 C5-methylase (RsmB/RsmF family)/NOL1/NOP2/fmu family ribosome biogenesis protein
MMPDEFLSRMKNQLGADYAAFLASYDQPPSVGLRVNTLKLNPEKFASLFPEPMEPNPLASSGFVLPSDFRPGKHPYHAAGLFYQQDPSAQAVAELLAPQPGERILDLAAAPGGKTTHLAALMQNRGLLVANDISPRRVRDLARNIERWGARNVAVTNEAPENLADHFGAAFDRVLVDAPCSAEGVFRKDPSARSKWQPKLVESCALQQDFILQEAARLVRPGGILVYSTCTFSSQENEGTLARFLIEHADFELVPAPKIPGADQGHPEWLESLPSPPPPHPWGEGRALASWGLEGAVRLWPHKTPGEGHFIAILRRKGVTPPHSPLSAPQPGTLPKEAADDFARFCAETLSVQLPPDRLALRGSQLYLLPEGMLDLTGLRVIHWGWWLGTAKKNRFEPSHALAIGLQAEDVQQNLPLGSDDAELMRYLRGEVLPSPGSDGWVLVTVDGHPLGWGKRVQGRLKPHFPSWLRSM